MLSGAEWYSWLKSIHQATALISIAGFSLRGCWMILESALLQHRLARILPHIIDTVFLCSGVALAFAIEQYPLKHSWLTAKLFGLLLYILLGTLALKRAPTKRLKVLSFGLALLTFGYIVSVAMTKHPLGLLAMY